MKSQILFKTTDRVSRWVIGALLILSAILSFNSANAATPQLIGYQALLTDSLGTPLNQTVNVVFTIWDAPAGGNALWIETHNSLAITDGKLSVLLGSLTPLDDALFSDTGRYLGVKIGLDNEMSPRSRLTAVPYAYRISTIDGASGGDVSGALHISPDPAKVEGDALIVENTGGETVLTVKATAQGVAVSLFDPVDSKDGLALVPVEKVQITQDGIIILDTTGTDTTITLTSIGDVTVEGDLTVSGNVGIGTTNPAQKLHVAGNARVDDTLFASNVSSLSPLRLQTGGITRMLIEETAGFVGIGTESPLSDLHIQSSNGISTNMRIYNTSTTGDPDISFLTNSVFRYTLGVDNSDADKFKISGGSDIGSSERLTITTAGNVGIGTTTPNAGLVVSGSDIWQSAIGIENTTGGMEWRLATTTNQNFNIVKITGATFTPLTISATTGNVGIGTTAPAHPLHMGSGAHVTAGGTWTNASDKNYKENFCSIDNGSVLEKISELDIKQWNYKAESEEVKHIGPVSQDFYEKFQLGHDDKSISTVDASGVALAAIQELYKQVRELKAEVKKLKESKKQ